MASLTVLGIDPSLNNFGFIKANLDLDTGVLTQVTPTLVTAPPEKADKTVRNNSKDLMRARKLQAGLAEQLQGVDLAFVEIPVGSQTARAMASYGICVGILSSVSVPLIQVTPAQVKKVATGNATATKAEMISWAISYYPEAAWLQHKEKGKLVFTSSNEHLADALGTIYAGVKTDEFKQLLSVYKLQRK